MTEMIERIVKMLVDNPEEVAIKEVVGNNVRIYELKVAKSDFGKVIGKHGQTIGAIRILLTATSAAKDRHRCILEIIE
ncbi:MAG: KH domain-containing protein [Calditrichaeota bacterium]|nr:KH domain-containing protein [Calditrichota bacterium]MCB0269210.1 KH domain-containing protein [Calditrichota bacterium]